MVHEQWVHARQRAFKILEAAVERSKELARATKAHADPRIVKRGFARARVKVRAINYGEMKARIVPRLDIAKNWFRHGHFWRGKQPVS